MSCVISPGMEDPVVVMSPLQSESGPSIGVLIEVHPHTDHLTDPLRRLLREDAHGIRVIEIDPGDDRIIVVLIGGVPRCADGSYAALCVVGITFLYRPLGDQGNRAASGEMVGRV